MSVMLYPCMLCVALLMCLFVLCVARLTVFVNCLVKQFAMCLGVVAILLLNVMEVFSVCGGALLDNNNNNCLKSNIQCIEIRVQWTVHIGSSHMHVHAVTRVHAVTPKLVICVMYLTSI